VSDSVTRQAVRQVSAQLYAQALRSLDFRRQANHLHRSVGDVVHCVHFQASQWGSASEGSFTINLVVTNPVIYELWTGNPLPSNPATAAYPVQERIGLTMPERRDLWWDVHSSTNIERLSEEVAEAVSAFGIPFLDQFPSLSALLERLRGGYTPPGLAGLQTPLVHAMVAKQLGFDAEARVQIDGALANTKMGGFRDAVQRVAERIEALN
jgi:uncharacterized protein DUF4304